MKVKWLGTASLAVEHEKTKIIIDPYFKEYAKEGTDVSGNAKGANAILITHPHFDHFKDAQAVSGNQKIPIYVSSNGIAIAKKMGSPTSNLKEIKPEDMLKIGDMSIKVYQSRHCKFDFPTVVRVAFSPRTWGHLIQAFKILSVHRKYSIKGDTYGFEIEAGGKKIFVLGSAGMDENTAYPKGDDLLVLAYQGRSKMHKYAMKFLSAFRPKAVTLSHWDDAYPPITHKEKTDKFLSEAKKNFPNIRAYVPEVNVWYHV